MQLDAFDGQQVNTGLSGLLAGFPANRHFVKNVNGHLVSLQTDEDGDISMEVIGFAPNQQNVQSQMPPAQAANSFQTGMAGQGMTQTTNDGSQVFQQSADARNGISNFAGTAVTNIGSPGMNQFAGANVQTSAGPNGFSESASFIVTDNVPSNPNIQQQTLPQPPQQPNGPSFMNEGGFGNQPNSQPPVNGGPVNFPVNSQVQPSQIGGPQNTMGGIIPSVTSGLNQFRDSDEFQDISVERDLVLNQNGQLQPRVHISRDSKEIDDTSLEVNWNLLPSIRNLLNSQLRNHHQVNNNPKMVFFQHDESENDISLEFQDILTNPVLQQQIQEIDQRLKRAPAARGKRLMEKYAEALALSSGATPATMNFSFFLSFLITWISVLLVL